MGHQHRWEQDVIYGSMVSGTDVYLCLCGAMKVIYYEQDGTHQQLFEADQIAEVLN